MSHNQCTEIQAGVSRIRGSLGSCMTAATLLCIKNSGRPNRFVEELHNEFYNQCTDISSCVSLD